MSAQGGDFKMVTERIRSLLLEQGKSINQMSKALGIGSGTFATWESNGRTPNGDILIKLSDYFGVSVDFLLGLTDKKTADPSEDESAALLQKPYMKEISDALDKLTPESLELVLAQIRAVEAFQSNQEK